MNRIIALLLLFCAFSLVALQPASAVTIDWTPVGNPGNAADTTGYGAVGYAYNIDKFDVTNSQYAEFLNAKDPTGANTLSLYNSDMGDMAPFFTYGGINFNAGNANGSKYTLISGHENHPVNYVSWFDAIRFANWLNNGQGNGDTESGAYTFVTPNITRSAGASVFLASENEWYKAAYYDPRTTAQGGPPSDSHYWLYPTTSNTAPTASSPTGLPNHANFSLGGPGLTDVGAYTGTTSPSGAFDMAGNVWQWNEAFLYNFAHNIRGSSFFWSPDFSLSSLRVETDSIPFLEPQTIGFRVANVPAGWQVPEPSSLVLAALGLLGLVAWGWRRRHERCVKSAAQAAA